jgi:hypothetical protein
MSGVNCSYVRIYVNGPPRGGSGDQVTIAECKILDTSNVNLATGGTATASTGTASSAFDGNVNTAWQSTSAPTSGSPQWLQYQFASAQNVVAVMIENDTPSNRWDLSSPITFLIQTSPDGTTWTTQSTQTLATTFWWEGSQIAYFSASTVVGNARASQVAVEVVKAGAADVRASQLAVEAIYQPLTHAKISQVAVEVVGNRNSHVKASQIAVEVLYPYEPPVVVALQQFLLP